MTSPLKLTLLAAAAALPPAAAAQGQEQGAQAAPPVAACLPEHAAMGHCTLAPSEKATPPRPQAPTQPQAAICLPEHAAAGHCTNPPANQRPAPPPVATPASQPTCLPEHAALGHCTPASIQQRTPPPSASAPQVQSTCLPEHAAMGHCTPATARPAPPQVQAACLPEHAAMGHCTVATPAPAMQPQVACLPEHAAAGHCVPQAAGVPEGTDLAAGNAPAPPVPTANAADSIYGPEAMAMGRHHLQEFHGGQTLFQVLANIAEYRANRGANGYGWELEGWYGGDINRFWFKSEGEGAFGEGVESAEIQALYSHAIGPYWNVQGGVRYDFKPSPSRVYATVQLEGLAPSFFDVEGALFLSDKGELMARVGGYYDQRITQRLILQPRVEFDLAAQDSPEIGVGAGLSEGEIGVRLRYDIRREFAPYIGVQYQRAFGRTARYLRDEGEDVGGFQFLVGVRTWF